MIYRIFAPLAITVLFFFLAAPTQVSAQYVRQVNLSYIAQRADVIVHGQVMDVAHEPHPRFPKLLTTKVTLRVQDMVRGPSATRNFIFREVQLGSRPKQGKRSYAAGQHLLLFMTAPSPDGVSSPIGIEQGRFHIGRNPAGAFTIANEFGNEGLFKNVEQEVRKAGRKLTKNQAKVAATRRGPVQLVDFISLVRTLTLLPRIR